MVEITIEIPESFRERIKEERIDWDLVVSRVIKQLEEEREI